MNCNKIYLFLPLVSGQVITGWSEWSDCPVKCSTPFASSGVIRRNATCDSGCDYFETMGKDFKILISWL